MRSTSPRRRDVAQGVRRCACAAARQAGLRREADGAERRRVRGDDRGLPRRGRAAVHGLLPPRAAEVRHGSRPCSTTARSARCGPSTPCSTSSTRRRPGPLPGASIPRVAGGGLFVDLAPHTLDFLDYVLGPDHRRRRRCGQPGRALPGRRRRLDALLVRVGRARDRPVGVQRRRRGRSHRDPRQPGPARRSRPSATTPILVETGDRRRGHRRGPARPRPAAAHPDHRRRVDGAGTLSRARASRRCARPA